MPVFWSAVAEIVGRKPVYLIAQTIFIIGTLICSRANSMPLLIVMRIIQVGRSLTGTEILAHWLNHVFYRPADHLPSLRSELARSQVRLSPPDLVSPPPLTAPRSCTLRHVRGPRARQVHGLLLRRPSDWTRDRTSLWVPFVARSSGGRC